jgi:hypothetical protein
MKNSIVGVLVFAVFTSSAQEVKNKNAKIEFHVSGNCEMCKKGSKSGIECFRSKVFRLAYGLWYALSNCK